MMMMAMMLMMMVMMQKSADINMQKGANIKNAEKRRHAGMESTSASALV